jgi:hypothetical protein
MIFFGLPGVSASLRLCVKIVLPAFPPVENPGDTKSISILNPYTCDRSAATCARSNS